jgi:hypothetical protein
VALGQLGGLPQQPKLPDRQQCCAENIEQGRGGLSASRLVVLAERTADVPPGRHMLVSTAAVPPSQSELSRAQAEMLP